MELYSVFECKGVVNDKAKKQLERVCSEYFYVNSVMDRDVIELLDSNVLRTLYERPERNPFIVCCENGFISAAKYFYEHFKDSCHLEFALMYACLNGYFNVADWLLEIGANIHFNNHQAMRECLGNLEAVKYLNKHGVPLCEEYLTIACEYGYIDTTRWLVENGVNVSSKHFIYACKSTNLDIAKWLRSKILVDKNVVYEALYSSCAGKKFDIAEWLLEDVDCRQLTIRRLYSLTACHGNLRFLQIMFSRIEVNQDIIDGCFNSAVLGVQKHILEWLSDNYKVSDEQVNESLRFIHNFPNKRDEIAKWICEKYKKETTLH